jgi:TonB-dependent SusC/RagA subfamily outer membrane receptor
MQSDKPTYGKRELVNLDLNVKSLLYKPTNGSYAISITDSKTVKLDSLNDNILSYLLLSSDIKGYIEEPATYFNDNFISTREKLDVLMLTQGWRRYSTANLVKGNNSQPKFYMEAGQTLSGKVLNILNKPSVKCDVSMLSGYKGMFKMTKTDSVGNYLIDGIEFPDSTSLMLKARKKKTFGDVEIIPDPDVFPEANIFFPTPKFDSGLPPKDYFDQSKLKYYTEGGMRVINLEGITVTAQKKSTDDDSGEFYSGMADTELTSENLANYPNMNLMTIFQTIPGILVQGDNISIRGSRSNPMILIDGIETEDIEDVSYLTTNDVETISVFKGADAAIFGVRGGNGVIAITLKKGVVLKASTPISMATITPLGYQKPTEFYMPRYDVDSIRMSPKTDLRTTIYWNPKLTTDSTGTIHVKFFTADKANNYSVVLEGISNEGEICRYVGLLKREDK